MKLWAFLLFLISFSFLGQAHSAGSCAKAHRIPTADLVAASEFNEFLVATSQGVSGFYLQGNVFRSVSFPNWKEAKSFYSSLPAFDKNLLSKMILAKKLSVRRDLPHFLNIAGHEAGTAVYRIKELDSLKKKILNRIETYQAKYNREYTLADLPDVLGYRIPVPLSSQLLKYKTKSEWAQALKIPESSILEIDLKGTDADVQKGKYYTAVHLTIADTTHGVFEVQVMSKPMSIWHAWDHPNVYKSHLSMRSIAQLQGYSKGWAKIIHHVSTIPSRVDRRRHLRDVATGLGLRWQSGAEDLVYGIDFALKNIFEIDHSFGFSDRELHALSEAIL